MAVRRVILSSGSDSGKPSGEFSGSSTSLSDVVVVMVVEVAAAASLAVVVVVVFVLVLVLVLVLVVVMVLVVMVVVEGKGLVIDAPKDELTDDVQFLETLESSTKYEAMFLLIEDVIEFCEKLVVPDFFTEV